MYQAVLRLTPHSSAHSLRTGKRMGCRARTHARASAPTSALLVDVAGSALEDGPEDRPAVLIEGVRCSMAWRCRSPGMPQAPRLLRARCILSPEPTGERGVIPALPGCGPSRARHVPISRIPRALRGGRSVTIGAVVSQCFESEGATVVDGSSCSERLFNEFKVKGVLER